MYNIDVCSLIKIKEKIIIDIRDPINYNNGHILESINIPEYLLLSIPDKYLLPSKNYYIYCSTGHKSEKLVQDLNNKGFKCFNISGGYIEYREKVLKNILKM